MSSNTFTRSFFHGNHAEKCMTDMHTILTSQLQYIVKYHNNVVIK